MGDDAVIRSTRQCSSCGAVIEMPAEAVSTTCSYCASALVDGTRGNAEVDRVAPFRVPKDAALDRLRQHLTRRIWAPNALRKLAAQRAIHAELRGILVPFFVYDAQCRSTYRARVGVHWYRTETVKGKDGKPRDKRIQETEWFPLQGSAVGQLQGHLECASRGLSPAESVALRAFDLGRAVAFDRHLLAGWQAELPSRSRAEVDRDAVEHIRTLEAQRIQGDVLPGDTHRRVVVESKVKVLGVELVLLPVWIAVYQHRGQAFRMLVHGQAGYCTGQVPVSRPKVVAAALVVAALGVLLLFLWGAYR